MSLSTALSRVTGFVRTWAIAYALGVTAFAASYNVANNIPNMIYELVAGGVISALFIPVFMEQWESESKEDAWAFASTVFNIATLALAIVAVAGTVWAEAFVRTQTFRTSASDASLAVYFFRFFAVQVVIYGAGSVMSGILNSQRKYLWVAIGPVFNNIVVIITLLGFYVPFRHSDPTLAKIGLAVGTTLGVLAMYVVQIPSLMALKPNWSWRIQWRHPGLRAIGLMAIPTIVYVVTNLVAVSFRNAYALEVSASGPATLLYAWMWYQLPYGVLAVALATAIFTELSEQAGRKDYTQFKETFANGLRATGMLIMPMAAMLIALAPQLVRLYRAGAFKSSDIPVVSNVLVWWGVSLFFFASTMFLLKTFYSLKDTLTPMFVNLVLTVGQIAMYATLTVGFAGWSGLGLRGIPIADAIFYALVAFSLMLLLRRKIGAFGMYGIAWMLTRAAMASALGGATAWGVVRLTPTLTDMPGGFLIQLAVAGSFGLLVSFAAAALMRVPEVAVVTGLLQRILRHKRAT
ncbi:MAG: murein biosynthesis integral membrane protein MurJ [Actinobacteria bacterium]|nr:murein biosynthesis integral membrane protein MurJ [Actinomycetota bacterium]MCG2808478.1 murein biosynthesis integral membrane protein MurJ [Coriobacteriia bacterium]